MNAAASPPASEPAARRRPAWLDSLPEPIAEPIGRVLRPGPKVAVIRLYGAIGTAGRGGFSLSDEALCRPIEAAFAGKPAAVALAVNSPGGAPAQSSMIAARIRRLADEKGIPVYAFVEDAAASGGYWLACAADEIWADRNSLLGSIGVIFAGFGLHEIMARNGIERRVHTAGERKMILDPFQPEKAEDLAILREIQDEVHAAFIDQVRTRRGERLSAAIEAGERLFDGSVHLGARAVELGLADGIGHLSPVMKAKLGEETRFREYSVRRSFLQRLGLGGAAADALGAVEARALWSRLGV